MREILFRGKAVDSGEWVYGIPASFRKIDNVVRATMIPEIDGEHCMSECVCVDPDTIGEYAGLTDENATRIFEGDIVSYNGTVHKVVFENRGYSGYFGIVMGDKETWPFSMSVPPNMMEVIGNVHDNPSLLTA